jgi:hypothetical protein
MSYSPSRPKKTPEEAHHARVQALQPYKFEPGRSGNPAGLPKARREQLEACEAAARAHTEEAIATLVELMRHSSDERVRVVAAEKLLERGYGRPRDYDPEKDAGREGLAARLEAARQRLLAVEAEPQTIDVEASGASPN